MKNKLFTFKLLYLLNVSGQKILMPHSKQVVTQECYGHSYLANFYYSRVSNERTVSFINFLKILIKCYVVNLLCSVMYYPCHSFDTREYIQQA